MRGTTLSGWPGAGVALYVTGSIELSRGHLEGRILGEQFSLLKRGGGKRDNWKSEKGGRCQPGLLLVIQTVVTDVAGAKYVLINVRFYDSQFRRAYMCCF